MLVLAALVFLISQALVLAAPVAVAKPLPPDVLALEKHFSALLNAT